VSLPANYVPEFESARDGLLEIAQIRSEDELLKRVVVGLAERPHIALARVWLLGPGDACAKCGLRPECKDQSQCLHLAASAGRSAVDPEADWTRLDGEFRRIPLGARKVGQIVAAGKQVVFDVNGDDFSGFSHPDWARREGIRGFNGQPIVFRGQVLGVVALFTWLATPEQAPAWLRVFADYIAVALTNARAFEENERLRAQLELENTYLREEVHETKAFGEILGQSAAHRQLLRQIEMVARTDATVLILGESGTGKELVAREIHQRSRRSERSLIRVNCASVPRELYESEFFGHARGAFTGAIKDRAGRFEAADGGTLFLDEVGEIPLELQSKFLRVLQEKQYERVGEERTRTVNVRIVAATNADLEEEVAAGRFRRDLFYRLNVFPVGVAPLRERKDDIPLLAAHFLEQAARRLKSRLPRLTAAHLSQLQGYDWPGNVRELQNLIERAVILAQSGPLKFDLSLGGIPPPEPTALLIAGPGGPPSKVLNETERLQRDRNNMLAALSQADWKIHGAEGAAELLGLSPSTLVSRMKKMGIKRQS
jgi:transcriptional regulator with GAF, ATPase, and Fis domain